MPGDVRDPESARGLVAAAADAFGRLDSIVVNAGVGAYGGILDATDDELKTMMRTNVESSVWQYGRPSSSFAVRQKEAT